METLTSVSALADLDVAAERARLRDHNRVCRNARLMRLK